MNFALKPWSFLLVTLAGWINRQQLEVIEYLKEENRVLKDRLGGKRIRFTDKERRRLAVRAKALGRQALQELETLVTPNTLLGWHRPVGSRTGAVPLRSVPCLYPGFPPSCPCRVDRGSVSSPRRFKRSMRISRTTLTCTLGVKVYGTYRAGEAFIGGRTHRTRYSL